jgi:hypothetical protein
MAFWRGRDWYDPSTEQNVNLPSLDLIVDANAGDRVKSVLDGLGIEFHQVPAQNSSIELETRKGFVVFSTPAVNITADLYRSIEDGVKIKSQYDDYVGGSTAVLQYQDKLQNRYADVAKVQSSADSLPITNPVLPKQHFSSGNRTRT